MNILDTLPVVSQHPQTIGEQLVISHQNAAVAIGSQVLARVKAKTADVAQRTHTLISVERAVRLRGVFDHHDQLAKLTAEERDRLRAVILSHDNDPIAHTGPDLAVQRPYWLGEERGRNVPESMEWIPLVTFWQTVMDAANAMVTVPGEFGSFGHDYRADMARFVRDAYQLPATSEEQTVRVDEMLKTLELERAERIKALAAETAPPAPSQREEDGTRRVAGVPIAAKRTAGAGTLRTLLSGKKDAGDIQ